jgi:hypothetical protein
MSQPLGKTSPCRSFAVGHAKPANDGKGSIVRIPRMKKLPFGAFHC